MEFSIETLKPIADQLAQLCSQALEGEPDQSIRKLETDLRKNLQTIGRLALGQMLSQAEEAPARRLACACGGELKYQRRREAQIESVFGWVAYERHYYAGCDCHVGQAPLDRRLGLQPGQVTAGLAALLALSGVELAFGRAAAFLEEVLQLRLSENTIRKETECFGQLQGAWEQERQALSQDPQHLQARLRDPTPPPERLYGSLDGAHVRIEPRHQEKKPAEADPSPEKWREMKVGGWYQVEPVPASRRTRRHDRKTDIGSQALRTIEMQYFCEIGEAETFGELLWASACQRRADLAQELVFVCDGARGIWRLVEHYFPEATQIVDWFHAEERLEKVAQEALSGVPAAAWLEKVRTYLWEGDLERVIRSCQALASGSPCAEAAATYFSNNAKRMNYAYFREQGYMIGSGPIESACKQIVSQRLKCAGAQWQVPGANHTAKARAAWLSGTWHQLCALRDQLPLAV
jgi:hypothetical protein